MAVHTVANAQIAFRSSAQNGISSVPPAGISYIGAGANDTQNGCGAMTPTTPGGNNGDILIALVLAKEFNTTVSFSAGWNQYLAGDYGASNNNEMKRYIYWRIANGTANDTLTVTQSGTCSNIAGQVARFRGVDQSNPFQTVSGGIVNQNSGDLDTGVITTTSASAMLLVAGFISDNRTVSEGGGWSEAFDFADNPGGAQPDLGLSLHYQLQTTTGNKGGALNWDLSGGGSDENTGVAFALTPSTTIPGLTISVPAGTTTNDVMVAAIAVRPSTITITPPSGWTLINTVQQGTGNSNRQSTYYRVVSGAEPASYTWTFSGTIGGAAGGILTYSGVDTASPIDITGGNVTPNGTAHTATGVTTTSVNSRVISTHSFSSSRTWTPPAGMTERVDVASETGTLGIALEMNDVAQAAIGATGNKTANAAGDADVGVAQLVVLRRLSPATMTVFSPATGGSSISADTNSTSGSNTATVITGPEIRETNDGGAAVGSYTLTAPAGFEFDTTLNSVTITIGNVVGAGTPVNLGGGPGAAVSVTPTVSSITFNVTAASTGTLWNSLTFSGIGIIPVNDCPLATSGDIIFATSAATTISNNVAGTLTEVAGSASDMYTILPGQSGYDITTCGSVAGLGTPNDQIVDAAFNITQLVVTDQFGNIDESYDNFGQAINYTGPAGSPVYTTAVNFTDGISTTDLVTTLDTAETNVTIAATDGSLTGNPSELFDVFALPAVVAEYLMEQASWDGTAGEVLDSSGNGLNGTSINGPDTSNVTPAIPGDPGTCNYGVFDQVDDLVQIADDPLLDISDTLTVTTWIYTFSWPGAGLKTIISKDENFEYHLNTAGQVFWWWGGGAQSLTSSSSIPLNEWHHVAIVYDNGDATIYIDGIADATTNDGNGTLTINTDPLEIAADQAFPGRNFDGWIDEVRVYNQALSSAELSAVKNLTRPCGPPPATPAVIVDWHFDEVNWGGNPTIIDYSGNGLDGSALGSTTTDIVSGAVCRAADLTPDGTSDYLSMPYTAMDGRIDFSVSFWAQTTNTGISTVLSGANSGQANEVLLWFSDNTTFQPWIGGSVQGNIATTSIADGAMHHYVWTRDGTEHCLYRDTNLQGCITGADNSALDLDPGGLIVGQEQDSVGGGFDSNQEWEGLIDEFIIFDGVLTVADIQTIYFNQLAGNNYDGSPRPCVGVDHYAIAFPSTPALTCEGLQVDITAHEDASNHSLIAIPPVGTTITLYANGVATPNDVSWIEGPGGNGSLSDNGDGTAAYIFNGFETDVTLFMSYPNAETGISVNVDDSIASDSEPTEDPTVDFVLAALRFLDETDSAYGTQVAGMPSNQNPAAPALQLRAVRTNTTTLECEAAFNGPGISVDMAYECVNPGSCVITDNGVSVNGNGIDDVGVGYTSVNLDFNVAGIAEIAFDYDDAGEITLHATKTLVADPFQAPPITATTLDGNTTFVVRPFAFSIESIEATFISEDGGGNPDPVGSVFTAADAGDPFDITVQAVVWEAADDDGGGGGTANDGIPDPDADLTGNTVTGNYGNESVGFEGDVTITHTLADPTGVGVDAGALTVTGGNPVNGFAGGGATTAELTFDEVGIIDITGTRQDYLGTADADIQGTRRNVGRFKPDRFQVVDNSPVFDSSGCTNSTDFTYLDQNFYFATAPVLTVTALNASPTPTVTNNYGGDYWKLTTNLAGRTYSDQTGSSDHSFSGIALSAVTINNTGDYDGSGTINLISGMSGDVLRYGKINPEPPFDADVDMEIPNPAVLTDSDGVCFDSNDDDSCEAYTISSIGGTELRFGRLYIGTGVGFEELPLNVPFRVEYFNGTTYAVNVDDDMCTGILATDIMLSNTVQPNQADASIEICEAGGESSMSVDNSPMFSAGVGGLTFTAPGTSCRGISDINIDLTALGLEFLQYDWTDDDGSSDGPYDENPAGRATFGILSRPREVIYTREPW